MPDDDSVVPFGQRRSPPNWKDQWQVAQSGQPICNLRNTLIALRNHPKLSGLVAFDEMASDIMTQRHPPGRREIGAVPRSMTDEDVLAIQEELQLTGLLRLSKETTIDAIRAYAGDNRYHALRDWLDGLEWDQQGRINEWLHTYLGARANDYTALIGKLFLIAMVARIYKPGCKSDYMLVLEGFQGILKSEVCKILAGPYFSDDMPDLSNGDPIRLAQHLRGKWLVEVAEMHAFSNAESNLLKKFLTKTHERYLPKYARREVVEPRQNLFLGTTNDATYLKDSTGNRRFWPVRAGEDESQPIDLEWLERDREQLFAEAVFRFKAGERWWPTPQAEAQFIKPEQEARYDADPWEEILLDGLRTRGQIHEKLEYCDNDLTATNILQTMLGVETARLSMRDRRRVASILLRFGWYRDMTHAKRPFRRGPDAIPRHVGDKNRP